MERRDLLWKQYELHVGLYKFYMDFALKINAAFYAVSGAVATYTLTHSVGGAARASLLIPSVLGLCLVLVFAYGAAIQIHTRKELLSIRDELGLQTIPEIGILGLLLWVSAAGFLAVSVGLLLLWCSG